MSRYHGSLELLLLGMVSLATSMPGANAQSPFQEPAAPASKAAQASKAERKQIQAWITGLGSPEFDSRKAAAEALEKFGAKALPQIKQELRRTDDPEIRWQTRRLIRRISGGGNSGGRQGLRPAPRVRDAARQGKRRSSGGGAAKAWQRGWALPKELEEFFGKDRFDIDWPGFKVKFRGGTDFEDLFKDFDEQFSRMKQRGAVFDQDWSRSSSGTKIKISPDGVEVEISDGDKPAKRYTAKDMESLLKKHPELKGRVSGWSSFRRGRSLFPKWTWRKLPGFEDGPDFRGLPGLGEDFEKQMKELRKQLEESFPGGKFDFDRSFDSKSEATKLRVTPDGVEAEVEVRGKDGKPVVKRYSAKDMKSLLRKYPELRGRFGGSASRSGGDRTRERAPRKLVPAPKVKRARDSVRTRDSEKLGIYLRDGDHSSVAGFLGLPKGTGIMVDEVQENSSAARLKLRAGDFLVKLNGVWIRSPADVARVLADSTEKLRAEYYRKGVKKTSTIGR